MNLIRKTEKNHIISITVFRKKKDPCIDTSRQKCHIFSFLNIGFQERFQMFFLRRGGGGGVVWQIIVLRSGAEGVEVGGSKASLLMILLCEFHKFDFPN